jgi:Domain of unknown function DUF29.
LREGRLDALDREHLAEEVEDLARREKREIEHRLTSLLMHLLKWQFQPDRRKGGWEASIRIQRKDLKKLVADNPSLADFPRQELADASVRARIAAEKETGIDFDRFPRTCPYDIAEYDIAEVLDDDFLPA